MIMEDIYAVLAFINHYNSGQLAEFDETYNWNPHIAEIVLTYAPKNYVLKAKLYAIML